MPHLKFLNRYWRVSGDEFSIPALCSIFGRILWTSLLCVSLSISYNSLSSCSHGWLIVSYLFLSIFSFFLSIICDIGLFVVSLKGSIIETDKRNQLNTFLSYRILLGIFQALLSIIGLFTLILRSNFPCNSDFEDSNINLIFISIVVSSQIIDVVVSFCCCYLFSSSKIDKEHEDPYDEDWALDKWENRCRKLTKSLQYWSCNIFGGSNINEGFEEVAKVLTNFFHHDGFLDVVPSDVVAGIVLVRIEQRHRRKSNSISYVSSQILNNENEKVHFKKNFMHFDIENNVSSDTSNLENINELLLSNIFRCSLFSLAIYTHIIVIYMKPCTGLCNLCVSGLCQNSYLNGQRCSNYCLSRSSSNSREFIEGDNFCGLNHIGLRIVMDKLKNTEVAYVSFKNDTTHKPYAVFLDHEKEWIVISIRGTLSLEDCITDVNLDPTEMTSIGETYGFDGKGRWAHGGMLQAAINIRKELETNRILKNINTPNRTMTPNLQTPLTESPNIRNYKLIVTGHSLGAGTAVLLSLLLKSQYPTLHCYAFGTPCSVLDLKSCDDVSHFVTSVVMGNDLVSRLNYHSISKLRNDVLDAISRARVNKMFIMQAIFKEFHPNDLMFPSGKEPESQFKKEISKFKSIMESKLKANPYPELFIPGQIIHFKKNKLPSRCCQRRFDYNPEVAERDAFKEIELSTTMATDHLPDIYVYEIQKNLNSRLQKLSV